MSNEAPETLVKPAADPSGVEAGDPARTAFHTVVEAVQSGAATVQDLERWFVPDPVPEKPFSPGFKVNEATVDVTGVERTAAAAATALVRDAMLAEPRLGATPRAAAVAADVLAEGDSWFDLPAAFGYPPTAIDILQRTRGVRNIAMHGDELAGMIAAAEFAPHLRSGAIRHFLFSGGGNDVLGRLKDHLHQRRSGDSDPANAKTYVRRSFHTALGTVERQFADLAARVRALSPGTTLYVHGYDYAIPNRFGAYLGNAFQFRGFHPEDQRLLCAAIIRHMVDLHNGRLKRLARAHANLVHVDLRGLLAPADWLGDEIHPGRSGAAKIAARLDAVLGSAVPVS
jgi:hypothetical protein